jgi:hypothetical protein
MHAVHILPGPQQHEMQVTEKLRVQDPVDTGSAAQYSQLCTKSKAQEHMNESSPIGYRRKAKGAKGKSH